jgi:hypothetical protein
VIRLREGRGTAAKNEKEKENSHSSLG